MATNSTPITRTELMSMAERIAGGLDALETELGVKQNTAAVLWAASEELRTAHSRFWACRVDFKNKSEVLQQADDTAAAFIQASRKVLSLFLGNAWTLEWKPTGFPVGSLKIPVLQDVRFSVCRSLGIYFASHPTHEVVALGVTAAHASDVFEALLEARGAFNQAKADKGLAKQRRDAAEKTLRKRVRGAIQELDGLLAPNDPRWLRMGLAIPANPERPEPVEELKLAAGSDLVMVSWSRARRASRYRLFVQVVGVDDDFRQVDLRHGLEAVIQDLPAGAAVRVQVIAANEAGEAEASPIAEVVLESEPPIQAAEASQ